MPHTTDNTRNADSGLSVPVQVMVLLVAALLLAFYAILRHGGYWGEIDTRNATRAIFAMHETGQLVPPYDAYPNGYGYQAIAVFLMHISGLDLSALHRFGSMLLMVWLVLPAWLAFREFTESRYGATLSTLLLLIQPEFLFVVMRGTHEKFTRGLMLLALYLLIRSMRAHEQPRRFAVLIVAFYICGYAIITLNNLLATSFMSGMMLALILTAIASKRHRIIAGIDGEVIEVDTTTRRLGSIVMTLLVLAYLFTFYAYAPARHQFDILETVTDRVTALLLGSDSAEESTVINPYERWVFKTWISLPVYFLVSLANWLLLGFSALLWSRQSLLWLLGRWRPRQCGELLLWTFYGAFTILAALSIVVDFSGAIDGNLQHRIFPSFVMLAAPLAARGLLDIWPCRLRWFQWANGLLITGMAVLAVLSLMKATNEPLVSNKWLFVIPAELQALEWAEKALPQRSVWVELDERIVTALDIRLGGTPRPVRIEQFDPSPFVRDYMVSDVLRARSARLSAPLPVEPDSFITYDNGQAQIYHVRPRSAYEQ